MLLTSLIEHYAENHDVAHDSLKPTRAAVRSFSGYLERPANIADFQSAAVNKWLRVEVERVARRTAKNYRAEIITLWRWAFDEELIDLAPRRIRKISAPLPIVEALTPAEVALLLSACDTLTNRFCGRRVRVPRKLLYRALVLVAYHTGFRPNDLMLLKWGNIAENGCVRIIQHKTKREVVRWLDLDAMGAVEAIRLPKVARVFGEFTTSETWRAVFAQLRTISGVKRGTPKWIRRTTATITTINYGEGAAGKALGHLTSDMARKHYIDQSQMIEDQLKMPRLKRPKRKK